MTPPVHPHPHRLTQNHVQGLRRQAQTHSPRRARHRRRHRALARIALRFA